MKFLYKLLFGVILIVNFGCSEEDIKNIIEGDSDKTVEALKEALTIGTQNSTKLLGQENGYLEDEAVKILLPEEAQTTFNIIQTIQETKIGKTLLEEIDIDADFENTLITLFNRAAEDAAPKATQTFIDAIKGISISDGKNILFGADNAATTYLSDNTYTQLQKDFEPTISSSLGSVKFGGYTTNEAWNFFAEQNNKLAKIIQESEVIISAAQFTGALSAETVTKIKSIQTVNTDLSDYVTGKALDGLFTKIADEEFKIRTDVNARITDLLKNVFGQLDN